MIRLITGLALVPLPCTAEVLQIGSAGHYPPYYIEVPDQEPTGMDVELIDRLCDRGGYTCSWEVRPLADLLLALQAGEVDVIAGGIGMTAERDAVIDFTCPHYLMDSAHGVLFARDPGAEPARSVIAITRGSIFERAMRRQGHDLRTYDGELDALNAVVAGDADIYFGNSQIAAMAPADAGLIEIGTHPTLTTGPALAVSEDRPELLRHLNDLLAELSAEGTLAELQVQWLDVDQGDVIAQCLKPDALM